MNTQHEMTQSNREGWDGLVATHTKNYHIDKLVSGTPLLNDVIRSEVGNVQGKSLVHLLCHIGTDTLSWAMLGAQVTGIDISPEAIQFARQLAARMNIDARFIESDILDVMDKVNEKFDIVFSSTGVLCWLPDIRRYAQTVRHLLKDGGFFYILDGHPIRSVLLDEDGEQGENTNVIRGNYFRKEPWQYNGMGDYTDVTLLVPGKSYEWHWTMGEIVTAFCELGMRIEFLHEHPQYFYNGYSSYCEDEEHYLYPATFSLKATAGSA